jgi:hypothetical protein
MWSLVLLSYSKTTHKTSSFIPSQPSAPSNDTSDKLYLQRKYLQVLFKEETIQTRKESETININNNSAATSDVKLRQHHITTFSRIRTLTKKLQRASIYDALPSIPRYHVDDSASTNEKNNNRGNQCVHCRRPLTSTSPQRWASQFTRSSTFMNWEVKDSHLRQHVIYNVQRRRNPPEDELPYSHTVFSPDIPTLSGDASTTNSRKCRSYASSNSSIPARATPLQWPDKTGHQTVISWPKHAIYESWMVTQDHWPLTTDHWPVSVRTITYVSPRHFAKRFWVKF